MGKKLIYLTCLVLVASMAGNASAEIVGHWKLDEGSGTIATDSIGGHDGTLIGNTAWVAEGKLGGALQFDGDGDYVDCGNDPVFNPEGSFSVTIWSYISDWGSPWGRSIFSKGGDADAAGRMGWAIRRHGEDTLCFTCAGLTTTEEIGTNILGNTAAPMNEWFHIACVYEIDNMAYIYINGEADASYAATGTITPGTGDPSVYIGTRSSGAGTAPDSWDASYFNGMLDDARFYNHAVTEVDVKLIMEGKEAKPTTMAANPKPANNAVEVPRDVILSWGPGSFTETHDVYFGTALDDVNEASRTDPRSVLLSQNQDATTYDPEGLLEFNQTYYWRVDEINDVDPNSPWKGDLWSFTVANFTVVDNFEDYNDTTNKIYDTWTDYFVNNTGMTVGHLDPPFAEQGIVRSGSQSMYMRYDNDGTINEGTELEQIGTLTYSEAERPWEDAQDWTANGADSLTLWLRGLSASVGSFTPEGQAAYTMTGAGADIWENSDQFHYAYKRLSGAGSITARVVSMTNTHDSAKAGVMIRQTLERDSAHAMVDIQPIYEAQFLRRISQGEISDVDAQIDVGTPIWVRLTRSGNTFTGQTSMDGTNWVKLGSDTMPMLVDVYVGLIVCSHDSSATCVAEFSDVTITGTTTEDWQSQDVGIESNVPEPMYVVLEDSTGNSAVITHPDPNASATPSWAEWNIPFADFTGVNPQAIKKMTIGVGDRANTQPGGAGDLYIDDIWQKRPSPPIPIAVENASFELPGTDKQNNWDGGTNDKGTFVDVPSWSSDTMATDSGVETGWNASDGEWSGFLRGSDPSVWQLTSYVIGAEDVIELKIDAKNNWQATTFLLSLYYDEAGVRVPVASVEVTLTDDMQEFSLVFSAADAPESVGKQLGIELNNVTPDVDSWACLDNVRLSK